jgi:alpha-tubulin suppressor-like RCC1 family protein
MGGTRTPTKVPGIDDAISIDCGRQYSCALRASGQVACWGFNDSGQLGDGTTDTRLSPVDVVGLTDAVSIDTAWSHS